MRITFVLPYAGMAGGIRVAAIYADRLKRLGHDVFVVSLPLNRIPLFRKFKWLVQGHGWKRSPAPEPSFLEGLDIPHRVLECHRAVTDADVPDADVVVATFWQTAEWVAALSSCKGAKAFFIQGFEVAPGEVNPAMEAAWRLPLHKIVISRWLKELALNRFAATEVSHVPNSVDLEQFHAPARARQPVPTVGLLYSTLGLKGCDVSLRAIALATRRIPSLQVVAFGARPVSPKLPLPAGAKFTLCPPQDQIRNLYAGCDVWICGSRCEGFHLPPLEAMACRCPVVSTRVGGPMDIIEEGCNGHLVDIDDADALANRLVRVLELPDSRWKSMSDAAHATAHRFTWDDATSLFEEALERSIERDQCGALAVAKVESAA